MPLSAHWGRIRDRSSDESVFGLATKTISMKILYWAHKAGVKIHAHSLRHKFATDILDRGGNIRAVQQFLGHESLATTEGYLAVTDKSLRSAVDLLGDTPAAATAPPRTPADRKRQFVAEKTVKVVVEGLSCDQYMEYPLDHARYRHEPFFLETESDHILIDSISIRAEGPNVAYQVMLFEVPPEDESVWEDEDVVCMEEVYRLAYT